MNNIPVVMFVDDEPNILKTLRRLFMDEDYDIHTAGNGREALDLIEAGLRPTVIVSDQRMPEMGGAEFLAQASRLLPDSIRMVLTGYADINAAVAAINQGGIYRYILKPWNDDDLKLSVREAVNHARLVEENRELTRQLAEKNQALAQANERLEEMVQSRTEELRQKVRELEGRDKLQQYLLEVHPLDELLAKALTVVAEVCQTDGLAYYTPSAAGEALSRLASRDGDSGPLSPESEAAIMPALTRILAASGQEELEPQVVHQPGFTCCLMPVARGGQVFGILAARRPEARPFGEEGARTIAAFAQQVAIGVNDCGLQDRYDSIQTSLDDVLQDLSGL